MPVYGYFYTFWFNINLIHDQASSAISPFLFKSKVLILVNTWWKISLRKATIHRQSLRITWNTWLVHLASETGGSDKHRNKQSHSWQKKYFKNTFHRFSFSFQFSQFISEAKSHSKTGQLKNRSFDIWGVKHHLY